MLKLIRFLFGISNTLAPKLSAKLAFRLFCTPQHSRNRSPHHLETLSKAQAVFKSGTRHTIDYEGGSISAYEFSNNSSPTANTQLNTCYVIHGWQSNSLLMNKFIQPLVSNNMRVILIDLPGHGQSSGRLFHIPLAVSALHAVSARLGKCDMMVTHSLGGAVAATALAGTLPAHPALPVQRLVTISSPCSVEAIFNDFFKMINLGEKGRRRFSDLVLELSGCQAADFDVGKQLGQTNTELLVIHAPDDKEVLISEAEAIVAQVTNASFYESEAHGHRRIISADEVISRTVDFFLPEGRAVSNSG